VDHGAVGQAARAVTGDELDVARPEEPVRADGDGRVGRQLGARLELQPEPGLPVPADRGAEDLPDPDSCDPDLVVLDGFPTCGTSAYIVR
jgi:hypothetical protein